MKKLQIVEPMHGGHHTNYLLAMLPSIEKLLAMGALEQAVVSVTPRHMKLLSEESPEQIALSPSIRWDVSLPVTPPGPSHGERKILHHAILGSVDRQRADGLICTSADYDVMQNALTNVFRSR